MLTCRHVTELVTEHLERTMPLADRVRFQMADALRATQLQRFGDLL